MSAPTLLGIETSSHLGSVALGIGSEIEELQIATPREQTERVLSLVNRLLDEAGLQPADLDALVFGRGPGSFTGTRIAAGVVQGLALAAGRPIVAVSSLAALALRAVRERPETGVAQALCVVDARMNEVYWAAFECTDGLAEPRDQERIGPAATVAAPAGGYIAVGDGFATYASDLAGIAAAAAGIDDACVPRARDLLPLAVPEIAGGRLLAPEAALPVYLREADAWRRA